MHRVRLSLPYYREMGWEATVVAVDPRYVEGSRDPLLERSIPSGTRVIYIKAFDTQVTRKFGLGSLALRSMWHYRTAVDRLLRQEHFNLIFFSTTQFPLLALGNYWKKRFGIPYVIDMQDPWFNDYYYRHPNMARPPKYWFAHRLNQLLEPVAMRRVGALIAVSGAYNETLRQRYPHIRADRCHTITFGASESDYQIVRDAGVEQPVLHPAPGRVNIVYAGIANDSMRQALLILLGSLKYGLEQWPDVFEKIRIHLVGTTYAPGGETASTVMPLAREFGVSGYIQERQERLPYFQTLRLLLDADILVMAGTDDPNYTASKLYPYLLARKPLLAIFHEKSSVIPAIRTTNAGYCIPFGEPGRETDLAQQAALVLHDWIRNLSFSPEIHWPAVESQLAAAKTAEQVQVFDQVIAAEA